MNFYIGNGVVVVPGFNDPNDKKAVKTVRSSSSKQLLHGLVSCKHCSQSGRLCKCTREKFSWVGAIFTASHSSSRPFLLEAR